jgi:ribosome biogenesis GTPase
VPDLVDLGWTDRRAAQFAEACAGRPDLHPGRVAIAFNHLFRVHVADGEWEAVVSGQLKHRATRRADLPAVGDWVVLRRRPGEDRATVLSVLPRDGCFSRKEAGDVTGEQVVAANIDVVFIVTALDADFSPRRVERYLLLTREGRAQPIVLLTKPDLCADVPAALQAIDAVAGGALVHVVSPRTGDGIAWVASHVRSRRTYALLGSSGVGKSTIVNRLLGTETHRTQEVRASDAKGRHTTTRRELVVLAGGGVLVDTPGMREVQLWDAGDAVRRTFDDVEAYAAGCHFTDCRHRDEPRCTVKRAVADGGLTAERLASYHDVADELRELADRQNVRLRLEDRRQRRASHKNTGRSSSSNRR